MLRTDNAAGEQHAENERHVADTIDDERFLAGVGGKAVLVPEADEQIRAEPHAFPSDEEQEVGVGEHQRQPHRPKPADRLHQSAAEGLVVEGVRLPSSEADRCDQNTLTCKKLPVGKHRSFSEMSDEPTQQLCVQRQ